MRKISKFILLFGLLILTNITVSLTQISTVLASERWSIIDDSWEYAVRVAPPELMQKVLQENISDDWLGDPAKMKLIKIKIGGQKNNLYLINTKVQYECPPIGCSSFANPLCGSAGCAYLIYAQEGNSYRRVFLEYFKNALPPEVPFLRAFNQSGSGLPCLEFTEFSNSQVGELKSSKYCYNGTNFTFVDSKTHPYSKQVKNSKLKK